MAIERIDVGPRMSQAVICNNMVYLAGLVAQNNKGKSVREQTTEILASIDKYLKQAGTDKTKLISTNIWLSEMNEVWEKWVSPGNTPVRATVEAKLAAPEFTVEIMVVAAL